MSNRIAVIFANGAMEQPELIQEMLPQKAYLVASDGGYNHMKALGLVPNLLVGDLDSVSAEDVQKVEEAGCEVLRYPPEKDETDLELALTEVVKRGYRQLIIVGGLGGRLDHTLANICLLNLPELSECNVRLDDGIEEVFLLKSSQTIIGEPGDTVSLLSVSPVSEGIRTKGLKYPLNNEALLYNRSRGISNVMTSREASVAIKNGTLLCIHRRERKLT